MVYEISPLLSVIAGASATIVAIIGGFIASKLISLSSERSEVELKSSEINDEITFLEGKIKSEQNKLDEDDALSFIDEHIDKLIKLMCLTKEYDDIRKPNDLSYEKMVVYWDKAIKVYQRFKDSLRIAKKNNEDNIPVELAKKLQNDNFNYKVCKMITEEFDRMKSSPFEIALPKLSRITGAWSRNLENEVSKMSKRVEWLKIQSQELSVREKALKKPKGIVSGLLLLVSFSLTGIVLPLFNLDMVTSDFEVYSRNKHIFLVLLCINLILTFVYFIYLLWWKKSKK